MNPSATENEVRSLQRRAEHAIRAAKPRDYIVRLLEQLVAVAAADSEAARFAHRHLAELRLEESPWRAALHLRRVLGQDPDDDIAQALMGLCQALLGNFRAAVAAYRRAVALSPTNPWYNHNLGHLLDVALGALRGALPYLRRAHRLEPTQDEVAASLAHCLGRLGARDEALAIARGLVQRKPRESDLRSLLVWLEQGARAGHDAGVPGLLSTISPAAASARQAPRQAAGRAAPADADHELAVAMSRAGCGAEEIERAQRLWRDYAGVAGATLGRPTVCAAAAEYALSRVDGGAVTQREVAERYGVSPSALQTRYAAIRTALGLLPDDPRYARRRAAPRPDEERH